MKLNILTVEQKINNLAIERTKLMLEAEELLKKITRLNTRYGTKISRLRKKIQALEERI